MYYRFTANPENETNDCIVRSTAKAENKEWKEVAREFFDIALEKYLMPNDYQVASEYMNRRGYYEDYTDGKITVEQFIKEHPTGTFIAMLEDHAMCIIDGDLYDLVDCSKLPLISYWQVA